MRICSGSGLFLPRPLIGGLLALLLPLCLLAGGLTAAIVATEGCQQQAVASDFCTKFTQHSDVAAVVPEATSCADTPGATPHLLCTRDTSTQPLPGYLTIPSGRSPPIL